MSLVLCCTLVGCASTPPAAMPGVRLTWAGVPIGSPPAPAPGLKRAMISRALGEWDYFGRQTVVFRGSDESTPHVGAWEDDDAIHSNRVGTYWRAVGKPGLDGVPEYQFRPATAHSVYLASLIDEAVFAGRWFIPRRVADYSPEPGDLICAPRRWGNPALCPRALCPPTPA